MREIKRLYKEVKKVFPNNEVEATNHSVYIYGEDDNSIRIWIHDNMWEIVERDSEYRVVTRDKYPLDYGINAIVAMI